MSPAYCRVSRSGLTGTSVNKLKHELMSNEINSFMFMGENVDKPIFMFMGEC